MLKPDQLANAALRVAAAATRPATVIVFGSYARGDATESSDVDLVVIEPELPDKGALEQGIVVAAEPLPVAVCAVDGYRP